MPTEHYIVAVKRECRDQAPPDWRKRIGQLEGVRIIGSLEMPRLQVEASPVGVENLQRVVGHYCHIEKVIPHRPSSRQIG